MTGHYKDEIFDRFSRISRELNNNKMAFGGIQEKYKLSSLVIVKKIFANFKYRKKLHRFYSFIFVLIIVIIFFRITLNFMKRALNLFLEVKNMLKIV